MIFDSCRLSINYIEWANTIGQPSSRRVLGSSNENICTDIGSSSHL